MKLIAAIVQDRDADRLLDALMETGFRATKIQTTGGFLRGSSNLILIGVEPEKVEAAAPESSSDSSSAPPDAALPDAVPPVVTPPPAARSQATDEKPSSQGGTENA